MHILPSTFLALVLVVGSFKASDDVSALDADVSTEQQEEVVQERLSLQHVLRNNKVVLAAGCVFLAICVLKAYECYTGKHIITVIPESPLTVETPMQKPEVPVLTEKVMEIATNAPVNNEVVHNSIYEHGKRTVSSVWAWIRDVYAKLPQARKWPA